MYDYVQYQVHHEQNYTGVYVNNFYNEITGETFYRTITWTYDEETGILNEDLAVTEIDP